MSGSREVKSEAAHIDAGAAIDTAGGEERIAAVAAAAALFVVHVSIGSVSFVALASRTDLVLRLRREELRCRESVFGDGGVKLEVVTYAGRSAAAGQTWRWTLYRGAFVELAGVE